MLFVAESTMQRNPPGFGGIQLKHRPMNHPRAGLMASQEVVGRNWGSARNRAESPLG